jgi:hypothetical protein
VSEHHRDSEGRPLGPLADDAALRCPQCGAVGKFGYRDAASVLRWYCAEHRLAAGWADEHLPAPVESDDTPVVNVPAQSLEDLTAQFHAMLDEGRRLTHRRQLLDGKIDDLQLRCGRKLLEMRRRVEAGEVGDLAAVDWWGWYADAVPGISRKQAERWMAIAAADDPQAAAVEYRERAASHQRAYRERRLAPPPSLSREPGERETVEEGDGTASDEREESPPLPAVPVIRRRPPVFAGADVDETAEIEAALEIFKRLTWNGRVQLIKAQNKLYEEWRRGRA